MLRHAHSLPLVLVLELVAPLQQQVELQLMGKLSLPYYSCTMLRHAHSLPLVLVLELVVPLQQQVELPLSNYLKTLN